MEELDLRELYEHFKSKILLITLITCAVCFLGSLYSFFIQKPVYTSSTTLVLTGISSDSATDGITTNDITINSKLVSTYREIVKSRKVLEQVVDDLELNTSVETLAGELGVTSVNDTEIIKISVTDRDPKKARDIANSLAKIFSSEVMEIYNVSNVSILDKANLPAVASNIHVTKQIIIYFMIGFALAIAIVFMTFYFDTSIKSIEQVEQKIGLPILGGIPNYNTKKRGNSL